MHTPKKVKFWQSRGQRFDPAILHQESHLKLEKSALLPIDCPLFCNLDGLMIVYRGLCQSPSSKITLIGRILKKGSPADAFCRTSLSLSSF